MVDGLDRDEQLLGDLRVREPGADELEDLTLAAGQPERVLARRCARPGRDRPDGEPAHLLPSEPDRGRRAEVDEGPQRLTQRVLVGTPEQGQRGLVGAAQLGPQAGGAGPVAVDLKLVGRGELTAWWPGRTGTPQPDRDRPLLPAVAAAGNGVGQLSFAACFSQLVFQPERLGARQP